MLDHVFTDAIGALRDARRERLPRAAGVRRALPGRRPARRPDLGDLLLAPRRGRAAARAGRHHARLADLGADRLPLLVHRRAARRAAPHRDRDRAAHPAAGQPARRRGRCSPCCPSRARPSASSALERSGPTVETSTTRTSSDVEYAIEVSYEGTYELDEATLTDGSMLDEHFAAMGGWIASTLVRLGDLDLRVPAPRGRAGPLTDRPRRPHPTRPPRSQPPENLEG